MRHGTTLVPVAKRLPANAIFPRAMHITFACQDEVRVKRKSEFVETHFQQINRASRVHRPDGAGFLERLNQVHAIAIQHGLVDPVDDRPVKIGADQGNPSFHSG